MESLTAQDTHECRFRTMTATKARPYHYVGSGLPNVYLVGVEYRRCVGCDVQSADIPCLPGLLEAIGKVLVEKGTALSGDELRFLRKRLRIAAKNFAQLLGVNGQTYSRWENGAKVTPTVERLVRLIYATLAKLPAVAVATTTWTASLSHEERIVATQDVDAGWLVQTTAA